MNKHFPAGYDPAGNPLTAVEIGMLLGLSRFSDKNGVYFNKLRNGKITLIVGGVLSLFSILSPYFLLAGILVLGVGFMILSSAKPTSVKFPEIIVLEHSTTLFHNRPILVSTLPASSMSFTMDSYLPGFNPHNPVVLETESELYIEPGDEPRHSINSIHQFHGELKLYNSELLTSPKTDFSMKFLTNQQALELNDEIFTVEDSDWMFAEYITSSSSNDNELITESRKTLDYFIEVGNQNHTQKKHFTSRYQEGFSGYKAWCAELENLANKGTNRVLESVRTTYAHIDEASNEASGLLLESVDHKIKENERKLEFEAKQKMDELEAKLLEMQESIEERKEELSRSITSQSEIVRQLASKENQAMSSLNATPTQINLKMPYTEVSGGGGSLGPQGGSIRSVSSYVRYETVSFTNPEYAAREQTHNLIATLAGIENQKLSTLQTEFSSADQLVTQRKSAIEKEQETKKLEYGARMEEERKELSRHSLKVQSLHQDILENPLQIDVDDVYRLIKRTWQQPSQILETHLKGFTESYENSMSHFDSFEHTSGLIASTILSGSPASINPGDALYSHWVCTGNNVIDVLNISPSTSFEKPIVIGNIPSTRTNIFQTPLESNLFDSMRKRLNPNALAIAASSLHRRGCIESKFYQKLDKLVKKDPSKIMVVV